VEMCGLDASSSGWRPGWRALMNTLMNHRFPLKAGKFLTSWGLYSMGLLIYPGKEIPWFKEQTISITLFTKARHGALYCVTLSYHFHMLFPKDIIPHYPPAYVYASQTRRWEENKDRNMCAWMRDGWNWLRVVSSDGFWYQRCWTSGSVTSQYFCLFSFSLGSKMKLPTGNIGAELGNSCCKPVQSCLALWYYWQGW
jgi:hypothetical protein